MCLGELSFSTLKSHIVQIKLRTENHERFRFDGVSFWHKNRLFGDIQTVRSLMIPEF